MEIERKYLIKKLPEDLAQYPYMEMEQAYLCTEPVVRVRKEGEDYVLTYKSKGLMVREEYNLPLTKESYEHLLEKADGTVITKTRYRIPEKNGLTIELDVFHGRYEGLLLAEVEFATEEEANSYCPPEWFGEDVTMSSAYHNSTLCDAFKGIPQFSQNSLFFTRATGQSLCFYKNVSTVAIRQVSRKSNRSFTGTSRTSAISKSLFREIDVFPFGASILLICVRLRFVASASSACVSPRSLR